MRYIDNWQETKERFKAWWEGAEMDRPILRLVARRENPIEALEKVNDPENLEEFHIGVEYNVKKMRNYFRGHHLLAEAFPYIDLNIGPGSMATYLGSEPVFMKDTVWYTEYIHDWKERGALAFDPHNSWWKRHVEVIRQARELVGDEMLVAIPDIVENVDILSAMRGPQAFCYDIIDELDLIKEYVRQIDDIYFKYYDIIYDIVKDSDNSCSYTAFSIWGPGRIAKVQCDFSAMMSPGQFRELVIPSLTKQCRQLDYSLYHLDGPDAVKHLDALMEIENLNVLQWTPGAGKPDGGWEGWYPIYDKVQAANKSLWIMIYDGNPNDWMDKAERLVKRYGPKGIYLYFPEMSESDAQRLMKKAEHEWR